MTKFTREDYEMAAKAAGIELEWFPARVWNGFIDGKAAPFATLLLRPD